MHYSQGLYYTNDGDTWGWGETPTESLKNLHECLEAKHTIEDNGEEDFYNNICFQVAKYCAEQFGGTWTVSYKE